MDRLKGKVAVISGGATGMGGAASKLFAAEGAKVAIIDRNEAAAQETAAAIRAAGGVAEVFVADVSDEAQVIAAVKAVEAASAQRRCCSTMPAPSSSSPSSRPRSPSGTGCMRST